MIYGFCTLFGFNFQSFICLTFCLCFAFSLYLPQNKFFFSLLPHCSVPAIKTRLSSVNDRTVHLLPVFCYFCQIVVIALFVSALFHTSSYLSFVCCWVSRLPFCLLLFVPVFYFSIPRKFSLCLALLCIFWFLFLYYLPLQRFCFGLVNTFFSPHPPVYYICYVWHTGE